MPSHGSQIVVGSNRQILEYLIGGWKLHPLKVTKCLASDKNHNRLNKKLKKSFDPQKFQPSNITYFIIMIFLCIYFLLSRMPRIKMSRTAESSTFAIFSNQVTTKTDIFMKLKFFPWLIVTNFNHP